MARDRANVFVDIWADQDWRDLSSSAQLLYFQLLTHGSLNYAGVTDWHPGRLAAMSAGRTKGQVLEAAAELEAGRFILVDTDTDEVLIRSFLKHDGVLKQPKLVVSMTNAFAVTASAKIREVIAFEVQKLRRTDPDLKAWGVKQVQTILEFRGSSIDDVAPGVTLGFTPGSTPAVTPNAEQAQGLPTTTATTTATSPNGDGEGPPSKRRKPERPLPADWTPNQSAVSFAHEQGVDVAHEAAQFANHAKAHDRRARDWDAAFRTWLGKSAQWAKERQQQQATNKKSIVQLGALDRLGQADEVMASEQARDRASGALRELF